MKKVLRKIPIKADSVVPSCHHIFISDFLCTADPEGEKNTSFNEHRRVHYDEFRMVKEMRSSGGSFYGEDAEGDDSAKTGKPEATISQNTPGAADAISSGKSSSSST